MASRGESRRQQSKSKVGYESESGQSSEESSDSQPIESKHFILNSVVHNLFDTIFRSAYKLFFLHLQMIIFSLFFA